MSQELIHLERVTSTRKKLPVRISRWKTKVTSCNILMGVCVTIFLFLEHSICGLMCDTLTHPTSCLSNRENINVCALVDESEASHKSVSSSLFSRSAAFLYTWSGRRRKRRKGTLSPAGCPHSISFAAHVFWVETDDRIISMLFLFLSYLSLLKLPLSVARVPSESGIVRSSVSGHSRRTWHSLFHKLLI